MSRKPTPEQFLEREKLVDKFKRENKIYTFKPYAKQWAFIALSATHKESALIAANQYGKTDVGAYAMACHLLGRYAPGWPGKKFLKKPVRAWIAGETSLVVRDTMQRKLLGEPGVDEAFGTGFIPKDMIVGRPTMARGIADAFDSIQVRHSSGGVSVARFKTYEQGRTKFQGETLTLAWLDEEPPAEIWSECYTRIEEGGIIYATFTPLQGRTGVVLRFLDESSSDRAVVQATLDEAEHFSAAEKERRLAGYLPHERDARVRGVPMLGSGAVFPFSEEIIKESQIPAVPPHWVKLIGIDFGIAHSFAAALMAWDRDNDAIHILHVIKMSDAIPLMHAAALRNIAANVPIAWPHDGTQREKSSGDSLASIYRRHGLNMLAEHATWPDGGYSREAAILELTERAMTGRFKVASHLEEFFSEFRNFHRKDGVLVKVNDDVLSAVDKCLMMKRFARAVPLGSKVAKRRTQLVAHGCDDEYFGL